MTTGALLYYGGLALWSAFLAYVILFSFSTSRKKEKVSVVAAPPAPPPAVTSAAVPRAIPSVYGDSEKGRTAPTPPNLSVEGFKAFQTGAELTVDDIVKGLSRQR